MEYIRFGDLYLMPSSNGLSRPSAVRGKGFRMIGMGELFACNIIHDMNMERVLMNEKEQMKYFVQEGDLLFARQSLVAAGAGKCSIVSCLSEQTTFESHIIRVRLNKEICNPLYYFYLFQLPYNPIKAIVNQCAQAGIRGSELCKIKVQKPSLRVQDSISCVLEKYDTLIENNTKRIRLLEKMAENLYKEWFVRFRFPGHERVEMENGLPKGWKYYRIEDLCAINRETIKISNAPKDILYLDTGSVTRGKVSNVESLAFADAPSRARRIVRNNSIIYSTVRPNLQHYGILKNPPSNLLVSTGFVVLDCKEDIANVVYLALSHPTVYRYCSLIADCAVATYPSIKPKEIGKICIALPKLSVCKKWNEEIESYYKMMNNFQHQNSLLARQRDLLLPRLMSGKLEVKEELLE